MARDTLNSRLKAITAFRALFVTVLLGTFFVFEIGYWKFPYSRGILYLIVALYALTIIYALLLRKTSGRAFAYTQLLLDVLSAEALIFLTGGIESWFSSVLIFVVISSAIVAGRRAGFIIATTGGILYGLLLDLQFYGILDIPYDPLLGEKDFLYNIFSHIVALYLTAYLIGYLMIRLERVTTRLEKKTLDFKDLAIFNKEVIEFMPSGLFTTDRSGRVVLFNRAAEEILGLKRIDVSGRHISEIMPFIHGLYEAHMIEGAIISDKGKKVIGLSVSKMKDAKGDDIGYIGIFEDLTEIKRLEDEMKRKERLADIGELAANIAHEIRNPLASLKGSIEMLRDGSVSPEYSSRLMDIAVGEMARLNNIITDFLNYSRPKPIEPQIIDLSPLLEETIDMLRANTNNGIDFISDIAEHINIYADPQRLRQVFWNLAINAVEAMKDKGTLTIITRENDGSVEIIFEDTGPGISPENYKRVFFPFFTTKENGTGLGLSIAYRIVEDHGGQITLSEGHSGGARFIVSLPRGKNG